MGGFFVAIFGQWDSILWALLVIMVLDCLTGVIKAIYTKTMSSEIGFKGLLKKITILIIVALSNVLQQITGDNVAIREIVIMFYVANEGISVLENVAVIYPRMPKAIKDICSKFVTVTVRTVSEYNIWGVRYMIVGINCGHTVSGTVGAVRSDSLTKATNAPSRL